MKVLVRLEIDFLPFSYCIASDNTWLMIQLSLNTLLVECLASSLFSGHFTHQIPCFYPSSISAWFVIVISCLSINMWIKYNLLLEEERDKLLEKFSHP